MTLEEKLKAKSTEAMVYGKIVKSDTSITMQKQTVIKLTDAIAICQQEIDEACKNLLKEIIDEFEQNPDANEMFIVEHKLDLLNLPPSPKESE